MAAAPFPLGNIVILDDEPFVRENLSRHLVDAGLDIVHFSNAQEAESYFSHTRPGAVIVDISFDAADRFDSQNHESAGLRIIQHLKELHPATPVLGYSSMAESRIDSMPDVHLIPKAPLTHDLSEILARLIAQKPHSEVLYRGQSDQIIASIGPDVVFVDQQLLKYLAAHPNELHVLDPRKFEEIVAEIWHRRGFTVKLTPRTRDGGKDIYAVENSRYGDILYVIECKRYARDRPVGVEIVRALYGVTEAERATMGLVATTSYFTDPAREFQRTIAHRMTLTDGDGIKHWLRDSLQPKRHA